MGLIRNVLDITSLCLVKLNYHKNYLFFVHAISAIMTDIAKKESPSFADGVKVNVEYCGVCDYGGHCLALAQTIRKTSPTATVHCKRGRQGSFEVAINDKLVYSKLQTMALPDYEEVSQVVSEVSNGSAPREIKGEQPINCAIS